MTISSTPAPARSRVAFLPGMAALCAVAALSGCMSSPTYGTGKTSSEQLLDDLTGIVSTESLISTQQRGSDIAYTPRPELVEPASLEVLPEPQQDLASADNPAWPESPEERRARIRAEATANRDNVAFRPTVSAPASAGSGEVQPRRALSGPDANHNAHPGSFNMRRSDVQQRVASNSGDPAARRYLSEPPVEYRTPAETAPAGQLGDDQWQKERAAKQASGKSSWRDLVPWL